jgi:subtilisin
LGELPAWSLSATDRAEMDVSAEWPCPVTREWAWGGATGAGTRVCVVDTGVDPHHPLVGDLERAVVVHEREGGSLDVVEDDAGDVGGHGTGCAGIVRALAPECALASARVLDPHATGKGAVVLAALEWALEQRFDVISLSLSTRRPEFAWRLHELTARAYFGRSLVVCAAQNRPVESYPWRFPAVVSVGSHEEADPWTFYANPRPPAELFARGVDVEVAWPGGGTVRVTGNSFATPHVAAVCALIRSKHPTLTPPQVKTVLSLTASNVVLAA